MSRTRLAAVAATFTCALMLVGGTGVASAAQTAPATQKLAKTIKVTGATQSGKKMNAKYTINRFIARSPSYKCETGGRAVRGGPPVR